MHEARGGRRALIRSMLAELYVVKGREAGKALELGPGSSISFGRAVSNDFRIRDPQVSRVHCRIDCAEDSVRLKDSSGNGTFVNEARVKGEVALQDGDRVRLGTTELRIYIESADEAREREDLAAGVAAAADLLDTATDEVPESPVISLAGTLAEGPPEENARPILPERSTVPLREKPRSERLSAEDAHALREKPRSGRLSEEETHLLRESVIPGYRLESRLGGGGRKATAVYRAIQLSLDRPVALKVLHRRAAENELELGSFLRETAAIARLPHPHIVSIHDAGRAGDRRFIVMELLTGGTAQDLFLDGPVPVSSAVKLGVEVAEALAFAHAHGIVHRALRPTNVLRDNVGCWKLVDFGFAKDLVRGGGADASFSGTPPELLGYVAPEQREQGGGDARSDVWAVGALFHHAFTGSAPGAASVQEDAILDPLEEKAGTPLATVVRRCLEHDPAARYGDAQQLLHEIHAALAVADTTRRRSRRTKPA